MAWVYIHRFVRLFKLHRELARHRGQLLSFYDISEAFLENIRVAVYRNMADARMVHLQTLVPVDPQDGSLSSEWSPSMHLLQHLRPHVCDNLHGWVLVGKEHMQPARGDLQKNSFGWRGHMGCCRLVF